MVIIGPTGLMCETAEFTFREFSGLEIVDPTAGVDKSHFRNEPAAQVAEFSR